MVKKSEFHVHQHHHHRHPVTIHHHVTADQHHQHQQSIEHHQAHGGGDGLELDHSGTVNVQHNQAPEDAQARDYHNDAKGWVRGHGSPHPHFDAGPSGHRYGRK